MINFGWGDYDRTYGVVEFNGDWTTENLVTSVSTIYNELKTANQPINLMIDLRYSAVPPTSVMGVASRIVTGRSTFPIGRVIVITKTFLWKRLYDAMSQTRLGYSIDIHFVEDIDTAYQLLLTADNAS